MPRQPTIEDDIFLASKLETFVSSEKFWRKVFVDIYVFLVDVLVTERGYTQEDAEHHLGKWLSSHLVALKNETLEVFTADMKKDQVH